MAQKQRTSKINAKVPQKPKPFFLDPRYKNTFWTTIFIIILVIFFIINNTGEPKGNGPYPHGYNPDSAKKVLTETNK